LAQQAQWNWVAYRPEFKAFANLPLVTHQFRVTIEAMQLAIIAMRVLEVMFFVGLVGSSVVILISFYEDGKELFSKDSKEE
jgi:hypothetical protein